MYNWIGNFSGQTLIPDYNYPQASVALPIEMKHQFGSAIKGRERACYIYAVLAVSRELCTAGEVMALARPPLAAHASALGQPMTPHPAFPPRHTAGEAWAAQPAAGCSTSGADVSSYHCVEGTSGANYRLFRGIWWGCFQKKKGLFFSWMFLKQKFL